MAESDPREVSYRDLFDDSKVPDDAVMEINGADLKNFLRSLELGVADPALRMAGAGVVLLPVRTTLLQNCATM